MEQIYKKGKKLGQLSATSICGNDISSSCLYVAAISIAYAGILAPISLIIVATVLYLYRKIYAEVGSAIPLNGGAYNCLLNSTSKFKASIAACMSILSYIATSVISAMTAVSYLSTVIAPIKDYIIPSTILVLLFFAILTIRGTSESAVVATMIFIFHITTLIIFTLIGIFYLPSHFNIIQANWALPSSHNIIIGLFFGFSAALLGISGFESSSNFIEEQKPGVFVKTLRNMWITVSVFNPLIAIIALGVLPIPQIIESKDFLLSEVAGSMGSNWLKFLISIDATLVLSGAVLTSFVGVVGLIRRMSLDRCLPQILLKTSKRNTNYLIILAFFLLCTSIVLLTNGELFTIAAVYTISFLGVMSLFAIGNILLKVKRRKLKRKYNASILTVVIAFSFTIAGIIGNILIEPKYLKYFLLYFIPTIAVVGIMFIRIKVLKTFLIIVQNIFEFLNKVNNYISKSIISKIDQISDLKIIYFTRGDNRANLLEVMEYIRNNELTKRIKFVHIYKDKSKIPPSLAADIKWIDDAFTEIEIDFELVKGEFGPKIIEKLSKEYGVAKNYMFIATPGEGLKYTIEDFGEIRLII